MSQIIIEWLEKHVHWEGPAAFLVGCLHQLQVTPFFSTNVNLLKPKTYIMYSKL